LLFTTEQSELPLSGETPDNLTQNKSLPKKALNNETQGKILIVEDEPEPAELLGRFLRNNGFETAVAGDGLSACRMINALRPDLILLDIMLPELDGWEICRLIRKIPDRSLATIPIIMISALHTEENRAQGLQLGANDYIPKPYSLKVVLQRSTRLIASHRAKQHQ